MAGEKRKTGIRARTRVVVTRDQSGTEAIQEKPGISSKTTDIGSGRTHPSSGSPVVHVDKMKANPTAVECVVSGIEPVFRSMAKELIKGGIVLADTVSELASETGEKFKDLLAEAKSEMETSKTQAQATNKTVSSHVTKG